MQMFSYLQVENTVLLIDFSSTIVYFKDICVVL